MLRSHWEIDLLFYNIDETGSCPHHPEGAIYNKCILLKTDKRAVLFIGQLFSYNELVNNKSNIPRRKML